MEGQETAGARPRRTEPSTEPAPWEEGDSRISATTSRAVEANWELTVAVSLLLALPRKLAGI